MNTIRLRVADLIVEFRSRFQSEIPTEDERAAYAPGRYSGTFYRGSRRPDIVIEVEVVSRLPEPPETADLFVTHHFDSGEENWRLRPCGGGYVYLCPIKNKEQVVFVNRGFDRCRARVLAKNGRMAWHVSDLVYDFLQVLLIHYLAQRRLGFIVHSTGVKDGRKGFVFAGKSGCGKSTSARLWSRHGKAGILNDDRVIVRRAGRGFKIYGTPWHGDFGRYLADPRLSAPLSKLFFIHHGEANKARLCSESEAFLKLYPSLFPSFWDKRLLSNIVDTAVEVLSRVPSYRYGFRKGRAAVDFVRRMRD